MPIGLRLQLFDGATPQANLSNIQALWWDVTEIKDVGRPVGRSAVVTTDATGFISLDLSDVSVLAIGGSGFLMLYKLDSANHENSLIFAGKVQTSDVAGGVKMRPNAVAREWVRNPSWLALPAVADTEQKVVGLYAIHASANFIAVNCAAAYRVDWGDGSAPVNVASGATAQHEYNFSAAGLNNTNAPVTFSDAGDLVNRTAHGYANGARVQFYNIVSTTGLVTGQTYFVINATADAFQVSATPDGAALTLTTDGSANLLPYKQAVVTITPQPGQNLTSVNFNVRHSATTVMYSTGWLDLLVSGPNLSTLTVSAAMQNVRWGRLQQFQLISQNNINSFVATLSNCPSLASVPMLNTASGTIFNNTFSNCQSLTSVPLLNTALGTSFTAMFSGCPSLTSVPLLNTAAGTSFASMFNGCSSLTSVPPLNTAAGINFFSMFASCPSLTSVPPLNTASGTNFGSMFNSCPSLTFVPPLNTAAGTNFSGMFNGCSSLTSVPPLNTAAGTNFSNMFASCSSLASVPLFDTSLGTSFASMFNGCISLTSVPLFDTAAGIDFSGMFSGCTSLIAGNLANTARTISYENCKLSAAALDSIYAALRTVGTGAVTFQVAADTVTKTAHGLVEGQPVMFNTISGTTGIANNVIYWVRNPTADTFQLSATRTGAIIDLTGSNGTGNFVPQTINVTGNYGAATDNPLIATAKGWTVTG